MWWYLEMAALLRLAYALVRFVVYALIAVSGAVAYLLVGAWRLVAGTARALRA